MFWPSLPTLGVSIISFVLAGGPDLLLAETKGCVSCLHQRRKLGSPEVMEQFCPCFQRGLRFHLVPLNSCWMYVCAYRHRGSTFQKLQWFSSSSPPARPKYLILFGHGGGDGKPVVTFTAESGRHLCLYLHNLQSPLKSGAWQRSRG